jgi:hypothetical protein
VARGGRARTIASGPKAEAAPQAAILVHGCGDDGVQDAHICKGDAVAAHRQNSRGEMVTEQLNRSAIRRALTKGVSANRRSSSRESDALRGDPSFGFGPFDRARGNS